MNEPLLNNVIEELQNYIKFLSIKKEEESLKMKNINESNDLFVEIEIIITLKNINNNLDFLGKNTLNKETRTI